MHIADKVIFAGNELKQSIILSMVDKVPTSITRESFGIDVYEYGPYNIWNVLVNDNRYYVGTKIAIIFSNEMSDIPYEESIKQVEPNVIIHYLTTCSVTQLEKILL